MAKLQKLNTSQIKLLVLMYCSYGAMMIMKTSIIVISPSLLSDPMAAITKTQFGEIIAFASFAGIIGKILFGLGADKFGGKKSFLVSLSLLTVSIILFSLSYNYLAFLFIFSFLTLVKSGGWPSIANIVGHNYHLHQYGRVWGYISTSSRFGAIFATIVLGFSLHYLSWRYVLGLSAFFGFIMSVLWYFKAPDQQNELLMDDLPKDGINSNRHVGHHLYNKTVSYALFDFLKSKRVWLIFLSMMGLTIMIDFFNFVPIFIYETLNISEASAVIVTSALPIGSVIAVLVGGYVFDSIEARTLTKVIGLSLTSAVLCIAVIYNLSVFSFSLQVNLIIIYICLLIFGFSVAPAFYLPMSIFSVKYGGSHSGILISILDIGGYFATGVFAIITGIVADSLGWDHVLILIMSVGVVTLGLMVWFLYNENNVENQAEVL
jgi:sugar phosphate permease